ncbi:hypothetical protein AJ80_07825 [Polytolypa hystricis UAMH7299]|uniref:Uncharacterized protein n=1 Tax=Polytolypa hystricis (strain UAMH7299) TaxID=1447883 RepID=A0A2B7XAN1_POLH7|nr:hypothetical protein AJ80_07825 [Polytolypa hystricis UAMH7299]
MASPTPEPIAIVGMACRFPGGAESPEKLWELVYEGRQSWQDVPPNRYNWRAFHHPDPSAHGTHNARGGFFLDQDPAEFDASFFGIPAAEAAAVDPQQRLLLEVSYEALENAGMPVEGVRGSQTGVYVALVSRDYDRQIYKDPSQIPQYHLTGCGDATACGRISYTFDLKGPSLTLDTGCSGGMIAVNLACQSLRLGESSMALVAGSNLLLGPDMTIAMSALHMLNDNGRCYPFDSRGAGYGRAEGVAVLVLKRYSDAMRDGNSIRAIIRNSGGNQDGKTNGILLPSSQSQEQLAESLYRQAGISPYDVGYVEAHGTGTQAGDTAEIDSLKAVFDGDMRKSPLFMGSIKANIGHTESTSGLAGVIKAVLAIEKGVIPPLVELDDFKPHVRKSIDGSNIMIPRKPYPWPNKGPRLASVNSFGFGGSNAHIILQSAPTQDDHDFSRIQLPDMNSPSLYTNGAVIKNDCNGSHTNVPSEPRQASTLGNYQIGYLTPPKEEDGSKDHSITDEQRLFVISAKSKASLESTALNLRQWVTTHCSAAGSMQKLAKTLSARRSKFNWRSSFVASTSEGLISALGNPRTTKSVSNSSVVFLFTGQGAQYHGMGRELLRHSTAFSASMGRLNEILAELGASWDLVDELLCDESESRINTSEISQPATTAIQIALVDLLADQSIHPSAVLGHSSGEVAAAYAAGILTQREAMTIAYYKGFVASWRKETMQGNGAMIAVGLGEAEIIPYFQDIHSRYLSVACINSPTSVTVSGDEAAVVELKTLLDRDSVFNRLLKVDIAYHSHHMHTISKRFHEAISDVVGKAPQPAVRFFSSVAAAESSSKLGSSYWVQNLVSPVQFSGALERLVDAYRASGSPHLAFVEIGPHSALKGSVRQIMTGIQSPYSKWSHAATLVRGKNAVKAALEMIGSLFEQGVSVDIITEFSDKPGGPADADLLTSLPPYAWDHSNKYWHESRLSKEYRFRQHPPHDLLGLRLPGSSTLEPVFRHIISVDKLPWLQGHIIDGFALYPGSAFLCMAIEALRQVLQERGEKREIKTYIFHDISFSKALVIPPSPAVVEVMISLKPSISSKERLDMTWEEFRVTSVTADGAWNEHCRGLVRAELHPLASQHEQNHNLEQITHPSLAARRFESMRKNCAERVEKEDLYDSLHRNGIDYSEDFAIIQSLDLGDHQAIGRLLIPDIKQSMPSKHIEPHVIHPTLFDAFMHIVLPLYHRHCSQGPVMLTSLGEVSISADILRNPGEELMVACRLTSAGRRHGSVEVSIFQTDSENNLVECGSLSREEFTAIGEGSRTQSSDEEDQLAPSYHIDWVPIENVSSNSFTANQQKLSITDVSNTAFSSLWAEGLTKRISQQPGCALIPCNADLPDPDSLHIIVQDGCDPALEPGSPQFNLETVFSVLSRFRSIIWVTIPHGEAELSARISVSETLRAAREEVKDLKAVSLTFDNEPELPILFDCLSTIIRQSFTQNEPTHPIDTEYVYRNSSLVAPRLVLNTSCNQWRAARRSPGHTVESVEKFHSSNQALKLHTKVPGLLDSIVFDTEVGAVQNLAPDEILVKVYAHGVNKIDVLMALGRADPTESMVGEFAGEVVACGSQIQEEYKPGDRVCGWGSTMPYGNFAKVRGHLLHRIDESISYVEGASIPVAFQTAYHALIDISRLEPSQPVLIHGAAGAVGQAAISIARYIGAVVYATAGSSEKRKLLTKQLGFEDNQVFSSRSTAFQKGIYDLTDGKGVDVVLNCCSEDLLDESMECVADVGFLIDVTKSKRSLSLPHGPKSITFVSIDMRLLSQKRPRDLKRKFGDVMALYQARSLKPLHPLTTMPISEVSGAFRLVQSQQHSGKVILESDDGVEVKQISRPSDASSFDSDGTYLVVGGNTTINDKLCIFLADRGAKSIISIVPSPEIREEDTDILQQLEQQDIQIRRERFDVLNDIEVVAAIQKYRRAMPPIKGVLHSETAIESKYLDEVTAIAFQEEISQGYSSTFSLLQTVESEPLDFYITLSSIDSTFGRRSKAVAATVRGIVEKLPKMVLGLRTHVAGLHLGAIDGINCPEPSAQDIGQQQRPMRLEELDSLLEFCTSSISRKEGSCELFAGVENPISDPTAFQDAMFSLLTNGDDRKDSSNSDSASQSIDRRIANASSPTDIHDIVTTAVVDQLSVFLALDAEEVSEDNPVTCLGLDSLLAIEFKNWIVRTMQAPMQTSEILDAPSLKVLVELIVQRSKLIVNLNQQLNGTMENGQNGVIVNELTAAETNDSAAAGAEEDNALPPLPIPELKALIERHLSYVRAFASEDEYKKTLQIAEDFQAPGSTGTRLYGRLQAIKRADPENWYHNLYLRNQYLIRNGALAPYMNFFFTHPISPEKHTQAERATLVASKVISYKSTLEGGLIKPRYVNEQPLCMDLYKNLFNTNREPHVGPDVFHQHSGFNYFVVLRRGHVFRVDFDPQADSVSHERLEDVFSAILDTRLDKVDWLGLLTADNRITWAKIRQAIIESNPDNATYFKTIEESAFIVCLDDGAPESSDERARHFHFSDGSNRWHDKPIQYIITANGVSGMLADHTGLDAGTVHDINTSIAESIRHHQPHKRRGLVRQTLTPNPIKHTELGPEVESQIVKVRNDYDQAINAREHRVFPLLEFGSSLMKKYKLAPNSAFQLVVQLAARYYFGHTGSCWETVLQSNFHKGRVEINQVVSAQVAAFCEAASDDSVPLSTCRRLLIDAVRVHSSSVLACTRAGGSDRFLSMLREILEDGEELPELYSDPPYKRARPRKLMSNCFQTGMAENGCCLRDEDGVWLHFEVEPESVKFCILGQAGQTLRFCDDLKKAAARIRNILEG